MSLDEIRTALMNSDEYKARVSGGTTTTTTQVDQNSCQAKTIDGIALPVAVLGSAQDKEVSSQNITG